MKFGPRFAFGLLGTAKALSVDDIFAHGQPQVMSDSSMSLASVAGALANMANQANASSSTTVQSIKDYISQMLADITTQHNIAQAELTDVSGYTSCDTTMTASMGNITTPAPSTTVSTTTILTTTLAPTSAELEQCLAEIQTINTSVITCESEAEAAKMASDAVCANFHYQTVAEAKAARCNDTFAGSYEQYLERDVHILADYIAKKQNCSNFTTLTDSKMSHCTVLRNSLTEKQLACSKIVVVTTTSATPTTTQQDNTAEEQALCENYHKKVETCSDYDSCYESVDLAKQSERQAASTLEASRAAEWVALKRMLCLVDVLGTADQSAKIQACMAKAVSDYNTSHLELTLPNAPDKQACGPFEKPATCSVIEPVFPFTLSGFGNMRIAR
mmetsp:Transcript_24068/g.57034  ORF Transcript_24068/g.57034 Transcript_24068/m.57034 type:complete len:389 (+) Transcript_24068:60-1226(+)|eukprot:CAMPEP_0181474756 /NCGR_PEP_ID=MMETSP1110-20121109/40826_1 /TAXON_ID=174948 /ORGANISM="Symbiodinium sp., Strain CCMP421" /LENGTH=388 /DNA_ID=CAMNT_0023599959 /DNA_START=60 /DNA_END=1226 /DNA_ORIENTATION=+